jgi:hypothetical protein
MNILEDLIENTMEEKEMILQPITAKFDVDTSHLTHLVESEPQAEHAIRIVLNSIKGEESFHISRQIFCLRTYQA